MSAHSVLASLTTVMSKETLAEQERQIGMVLDMADEEMPKLSIKHFEEHFLSYFMTGEFTEEMVSAWLGNVSSSPVSPVKLIDETGEVLVIVPGLINTSQISPDPGNDSSKTLGHVSAQHAQERSRIPAIADRQYQERLMKKIPEIVRTSKLTENFFKYYEGWTPDGIKEEEVADPEHGKFNASSLFE